MMRSVFILMVACVAVKAQQTSSPNKGVSGPTLETKAAVNGESKVNVAPGLRAQAKCNEYAQSVFVNLLDPLDDTQVIKFDTCSIEVTSILVDSEAFPRQFPHMALIGFGSKEDISWRCGGSLVSERFVVSAAHCHKERTKGPAKWVRLGDNNIRSKKDDEEGWAQSVELEIIETIIHPSFKEPIVYFDIALYKLEKDVKFNEFVRPLCLQLNHHLPQEHAVISGWGQVAGGSRSDTLQHVNTSVWKTEECRKEYAALTGPRFKDGVLDETQLCAGKAGRHTGDSCYGDSGGPLQIRMQEPYCMYALVGVNSFGVRCGDGKPDVFTRVSYFVPWIENNVWPVVE